MAIQVGDNFSYQGAKPLDARLKYDTVAAMKAAVENTLYDGCLAYVTATKKYYSFDSSNTSDPTTGKWRELETGADFPVGTEGQALIYDENGEVIAASPDTTPTENSDNLITSGAVAEALADKQDTLEYDTEPTEGSTKALTSGAVYTALAGAGIVTDDTLTIEGAAADAKAAGDVIRSLETTVSSTTNILSVDTKTEIDISGYITGQIKNDGTVGTSTYAKHSDFILIEDGARYELYTKSTPSWYYAFYSSNTEASFLSNSAVSLGEHATADTISIVIPEGAVYMRVSLSMESASRFYKTTSGLYDENIPEKLEDLETTVEEGGIEKVYYVRPASSQLTPAADFNNITAALVALKDDDSPKVIYVEAATYDGFVDMGGQTYIDSIPSDVTSSEWRDYTKAIIPPNTRLIGLGMVTINFVLPVDTPAAKVAVLSPLAIKGVT